MNKNFQDAPLHRELIITPRDFTERPRPDISGKFRVA